jgi:hypothetical protein
MPFTFAVADFTRALKTVSKAVDSASLVPEYGYVSLQLNGNHAMLTSFNGILCVRVAILSVGDIKEELILAGDKLIKYFSSFDMNTKATVEIKPSPKQVVFTVSDGGHLTVTKPAIGQPFHTIQNPGSKITILDDSFFKASNLFLASAGSDMQRPATTTAKIDFASGLIWTTNNVATGEYNLGKKAAAPSIIIPNAFITIVKAIFESDTSNPFELYYSKSSVLAITKNRSVAFEHALPIVDYPDFGTLMNPYRQGLTWFTTAREEFVSRFNRIGAMLSDTDRLFKITCKSGVMEFDYSMADSSTIIEKLKYKETKNSVAMLLNFDYLKTYIDAAAKCDRPELKIGLISGQSGIVFDIGEPFLFVVLPVQVTI